MYTFLVIVQVLFAIALIFIVAMQTTRHEGLSGTVGGQVSSQFRGKLGRDRRAGGRLRKTRQTRHGP